MPRIFYNVLLLFVITTFPMSPSSAQTRRALLVGISNYNYEKTGWKTVHGSNDVALMNKALSGFKVKKLVDSAATYGNIIKSIKALVQETKSGDIVYLHFSGHGQPYEDSDGDEDDGWDEAFIPYDAHMQYEKGVYEGECHLTDDILHGYIQQLRKKAGKSGFVYVSIDACHSGESFRGLTFSDDEGTLIDDKFIASLDLIPEESDDENCDRGSTCGFTPNNKIYAVSRSNAKIHGRIQSSPTMANVVVMEACLSTGQSKEIKRYVVGKDNKKRNFYCGPLSYSIYKVLTSSKEMLSANASWVNSLRSVFDKVLQTDNDQQLVIEMTE